MEVPGTADREPALGDPPRHFRAFGPDEALSNRLGRMFEATHRTWNYRTEKNDEFLSPNGRVMDAYLSEHLVEGMLEGYLLTGRYGFINSYEAFIKVVDSMIGQHAKWLKLAEGRKHRGIALPFAEHKPVGIFR